MARTVAVVAHSHWDREWYVPFETYRVQLLSMMDGLLDLLESESDYEYFHLDGQMAVLEDYLESRPEARPRVEALVSSGRLGVGPWYVLMDEFCVSAETIVRNLQLGMARRRAIGGDATAAAPAVGYLPDMFGHVGQMPQILGQAGIHHAVVWRGVPAAVASRAFWWAAPDRSRVRAEYLPVGYASGAFLPKRAEDLVRRLCAYERELEHLIGPSGDILLMSGGDHQAPQAWLGPLLREANATQDRYRFQQTRLSDFLASQLTEGLGEWSGELRSGARAPLLMGVLSNRVDVKQAAATCETALERLAEPLAALWLPPDLWPADLLDRAWLEVIRNSAHDSVCACSTDQVVRAVLHRYDNASAMAEAIRASATAIAGVATASAGHVLVNPLPFARGGVVELDLPGTVAPAGAQQVSVAEAASTERHGQGRDLGRLLGELTAEGWLGPSGRGVAARLSPMADHLVMTIEQDPSRKADPAMAPVMAEAWARAGAGRDEPLTVRVERSPSQRVAVRVDDVPGFGWRVWPSGASGSTAPPVQVERWERSVEVSNGFIRVSVDATEGTFALDGVAGHNLIEEEADEGDTYNFSPSPGRPTSNRPSQTALEVIEAGPVRAVIRVRRMYPWQPETEVVSDLQVCAGDAEVVVTTSFDHRGRDHRVRASFPLGCRAEVTEAESAFGTAVRGQAEGGPQEPAFGTFPSRRFVTAGPATITHQGLLEYELVGDGTAVALTLLRATGILSRPAPPARPNAAGPPVPLRDAQLPGPQSFRYAVARHCADPWALADRVWTPLLPVVAEGNGPLPDTGSRLRVEGARVSALRREEGAIEVRVFNPGDSATTVRIPGHSGALVDLRGEVLRRWEESFELAAWGFATARLDTVSLD